MMETQNYRLYAFSHRLPGRIERFVSLATGRRMERLGHVAEALDRDGATPCFLRLRPLKKQIKARSTVKADVREEDAIACFSRKDVEALAGRCFKDGRSRTARMSEEQKAARVQRILDESGAHVGMEDRVERATNKERAWARIGNLLNEVRVVESVCR